MHTESSHWSLVNVSYEISRAWIFSYCAIRLLLDFILFHFSSLFNTFYLLITSCFFFVFILGWVVVVCLLLFFSNESIDIIRLISSVFQIFQPQQMEICPCNLTINDLAKSFRWCLLILDYSATGLRVRAT